MNHYQMHEYKDAVLAAKHAIEREQKADPTLRADYAEDVIKQLEKLCKDYEIIVSTISIINRCEDRNTKRKLRKQLAKKIEE